MNKANRKLSSQDCLIYLSMVYAVVSVTMNIFCMKALSFGTATIVCDGGQLISWIVFLVSNVIVEAWDLKTSMRLVTGTAIISFLAMLLARLIVVIPTLGSYQDQAEAFAMIFSNGPRTILASATAFWVGGFVNVNIIDRIRESWSKKHKDSNIMFFFRASFSTLIGQLVDNALFMILAFAPIGLSVYEMAWYDILMAVWYGTLIELVLESCVVPFITIPLVKKIKAIRKAEEETQQSIA